MTLLHDVYHAYLTPLLKKHAGGEVLTMEDLSSSLEAAKAVLSSSPNDFVLQKALALHNNQARAYKAAAKKSLQQWALTLPLLPPVQKGETLAAFVARCYTILKDTRPNWHITDADLDECALPVLRQRATQAYQSQQPALQSPSSQHQPQSTAQPQQTKKTAAAISGHKRGISSLSGNSGESDEVGEVDQQAEQNLEVEATTLDDVNEEGGDVEDDDGESGEIVDEESSQPGDDTLATTVGIAVSTSEKPTANGSNGTNNKRKKQPQQQQARNTKKHVVKRKSTIQKKAPPGGGNQIVNNYNVAAKKTTARKKPQGKKGRVTTKNP